MIEELIEKAFCEGYEYAQREFNSKESKRINNELAMKLGAMRLYNYDNQDKDLVLRLGRIGMSRMHRDPFEEKRPDFTEFGINSPILEKRDSALHEVLKRDADLPGGNKRERELLRIKLGEVVDRKTWQDWKKYTDG